MIKSSTSFYHIFIFNNLPILYVLLGGSANLLYKPLSLKKNVNSDLKFSQMGIWDVEKQQNTWICVHSFQLNLAFDPGKKFANV